LSAPGQAHWRFAPLDTGVGACDIFGRTAAGGWALIRVSTDTLKTNDISDTRRRLQARAQPFRLRPTPMNM